MTSDFLTSRVLLNLDSEEEGHVCIGSAGGFESTITLPMEPCKKDNMTVVTLEISGLLGGHTGADIHLGRLNALMAVARTASIAATELSINAALVHIHGGTACNAVPSSCSCKVAVPAITVTKFIEECNNEFSKIQDEYAAVEGKVVEGSYAHDMKLKITAGEPLGNGRICPNGLRAILLCPDGVQRMSPTVAGLVETSTCLVTARTTENGVELAHHARSSSNTQMKMMENKMDALAHTLGAKIDSPLVPYPGWLPNPLSDALKVVQEGHAAAGQEPPKVYAIHAGLESGFIIGQYPTMDAVSVGPTIHDPHTPKERIQIPSVDRFWLMLLETIKLFGKK
eukprot:TRINITY_DN33343_c0_g1_i1.p1 TRINITY_DN33343_c0_g1~~TRINITY_DN33343_c0_g1_i1.p1  ORF type:complete len:371 (+),score=106.57 TRINITY_DN33343_c0_g1_i1:95-1114(+)